MSTLACRSVSHCTPTFCFNLVSNSSCFHVYNIGVVLFVYDIICLHMTRTADRISILISQIKRHKTALVLVVSFLFFAVIWVGIAFAADPDPATSATGTSWTAMGVGYILSLLTLIYSAIAWAIGKLITIVIGLIIIPILGYNNFADSNIIDIGWPLVRDVVNMFVIILLLFIAIKTMFGVKGSGVQEAQQQILRVFFAVVAVNFSRTICVFFIDFGQVVMFTFVNAIKDIAAGNFIQLFQLNSALSVDSESIYASLGENGGGLNAFGFLGSAYAIVVLLAIVLAVLVILAIVFLYRIVILWVLVILSPMAFFLWGAQNIIPQAGGQQGRWWKSFSGAIMLGPIMAFFLWLGLAAASGGSIAASERFESPESSDSGEFGTGLYNEIFQVDRLLSLMIGIIIIVAGFQAASSAAGDLGGVAARLITEDKGRQLMKSVASAPARYTYRTGKAVGAGVGGLAKEGFRQAERRGGYTQKFADKLSRSAGRWQASGGIVKTQIGRSLGSFAGSLESRAKGVSSEGRKMAKERVSGMAQAERLALTQAFSGESGGDAYMLSRGDDLRTVGLEYLQDKKMQKKDKEQLIAGGMDEVEANEMIDKKKANILRDMDGHYEDYAGGDDNFKKKQNSFQTANLHLVVQNLKDSGKSSTEIAEEIDKIVGSEHNNTRDLTEDAWASPEVRAAYDRKTFWADAGGRISVADQIEKGKNVNPDLQRAIQGQSKSVRNADFATSSSFAISGAMGNADFNIGNLTIEQLEGGNSANITEGIADAVVRGRNVGKASTPAVNTKLVEALENSAGNDNISIEKQRKYRMAQAVVSGQNTRIGIQADGSFVNNTTPAEVHQVIRTEPTIIANLTKEVEKGKSDVTTAIASAITSKDLNTLQQRLLQAVNDGNKSQEALNLDTLKNIRTALDAELSTAGAPKSYTTLRNRADIILRAVQSTGSASTPPTPSTPPPTPSTP